MHYLQVLCRPVSKHISRTFRKSFDPWAKVAEHILRFSDSIIQVTVFINFLDILFNSSKVSDRPTPRRSK
ncbi:hypothetical protein OMCYN_01693 [cyanobiont of Ornithocercus magnificus]|nr:hypothetical protein OMCYN_01693 [cyanobiont of Ornithocercus magnificus]